MSGPDDTKEAAELPSSHGYAATDRAVPSERKPGKQLSASLPLSKRENIHTEICGTG